MQYRTWRELSHLPDGLSTGPRNLISDVPGITVGHHTLIEDSPRILRTGVTALCIENVLDAPVAAASHVFNGFGKSMGLVQVDELGTIESPIYFTNTLSIGAVQQGAVRAALRSRPKLRSYNAVVMECNDGLLSDIGALAITPDMAIRAHDAAQRDFELGSVGAGTGMTCFGYKGGIGSSSRVLEIDGRDYTLGALVLTNFGQRDDLRLPEEREPKGPGDGAAPGREGFDLRAGRTLPGIAGAASIPTTVDGGRAPGSGRAENLPGAASGITPTLLPTDPAPGTWKKPAPGNEITGDGAGSLILVVGTDIPLLPHQLKRVARHMPVSIGLLGCPGHPNSGDIALAFSIGTRLGGNGSAIVGNPTNTDAIQEIRALVEHGAVMTQIFRAAAWCCAEAILDSMTCSPPMKGLHGEVPSLLGTRTTR